jgi:hypothetical protein
MCTQNDTVVVSEGIAPTKHYHCMYDGCSVSSVVELCCQVCNKHFCLEHRHHGCVDKDQAERDEERDKWEAPRKQFEIAKSEVERQVGN